MATKLISHPFSDKPVERVLLADLQLDIENPRFGESAEGFTNQNEVVDWIVEQFGVDDVISSLAINGYFDAEPLIVEESTDGSGYVVKEGNRRLAACLILAKDPRARKHWKKADSILKAGRAVKWSNKTKVPVLVFTAEEAQKLLSYLGVRHIVSSQPWDSFAKATWIAHVISTSNLTLDEIAEVTGDKNRTIARLLEGYHFVKQLIAAGLFDPKSSYRRGRGSNVDYPFSWVYTLLGYGPVREWLALGSTNEPTKPIPAKKINEAALALKYLFGDKAKGSDPAIADSRQIPDLAVALGNVTKRNLLKNGYSVDRIEEESQPISDRLASQLLLARNALREASGLLAEQTVKAEEANELLELVRSIRKQASEIFKNLDEVVNEEETD